MRKIFPWVLAIGLCVLPNILLRNSSGIVVPPAVVISSATSPHPDENMLYCASIPVNPYHNYGVPLTSFTYYDPDCSGESFSTFYPASILGNIVVGWLSIMAIRKIYERRRV